ncbi:glycosyltransferase family 2 protein [Gemmobacter serpentinus]|uniref:glycosyltransferase family 2 protein n=1 Tax=Gemmobacter serpentinus TaxID=2652247 RepID=UPI00124BDA6E|nr:glycosyltransferase family 2 protein [Gemmobacter serpentinus]
MPAVLHPRCVTIIVPAYRHAAFIRDSLLSVHDQTYPHLELVVIDDASDDGTAEAAEAVLTPEFTARFARVTLLRNAGNLGAHATINRGIAESRAAYLAILNSDDLYHPDRITRLMEALQASGSELAFSLVDVLRSDPPETPMPEFFRLMALRQKLALHQDPSTGFALLRANIAISTGNFLFTRRLFDQAGPFQPLRYCHDWDFLLQALFFTEPVAVEAPLYTYRLHGHNSFASLGDVLAEETAVVIRRFLQRGQSGPSPNPVFPCAANWPGFFDIFLRDCHHVPG